MITVPILTYHQIGRHESESAGKQGIFVSAAQFNLQMRLLASLGYRSLGLGELIRDMMQGVPRETSALVITFDDGYEGAASVALPIMQRYGFRGTMFLIGEDYASQRGAAHRAFGVLDGAQVRSLLESGWEIGSHSLTHPDLNVMQPNALEVEIVGSKQELETRFGVPIRWFAYPYGSASPTIANLVERAGYLGAVTTEFGRNHRFEDRYALKRIAVGSAQGIAQFFYRLRWARR